jgi:hypothetical protein
MSKRQSPSSIFAAFGVATLVGGTVAGIAPGLRTNPGFGTIILSRNTPGGTLGFLTAPTASRGTDATTFTITSNNAADVSSVNWLVVPRLDVAFGAPAGGPFRRSPSGPYIARGKATLVGGTKTVTTEMQFSDNAKIFVCANTFAGTPGKLSAPQASVDGDAGTFVINSNSGADTSSVDWVLLDGFLRGSPSGAPYYQANGNLIGGSITLIGQNQADSPNLSILASVGNIGGTASNLSVPDAQRLNDGYVILAGGADTSFVETIAI